MNKVSDILPTLVHTCVYNLARNYQLLFGISKAEQR